MLYLYELLADINKRRQFYVNELLFLMIKTAGFFFHFSALISMQINVFDLQLMLYQGLTSCCAAVEPARFLLH